MILDVPSIAKPSADTHWWEVASLPPFRILRFLETFQMQHHPNRKIWLLQQKHPMVHLLVFLTFHPIDSSIKWNRNMFCFYQKSTHPFVDRRISMFRREFELKFECFQHKTEKDKRDGRAKGQIEKSIPFKKMWWRLKEGKRRKRSEEEEELNCDAEWERERERGAISHWFSLLNNDLMVSQHYIQVRTVQFHSSLLTSNWMYLEGKSSISFFAWFWRLSLSLSIFYHRSSFSHFDVNGFSSLLWI